MPHKETLNGHLDAFNVRKSWRLPPSATQISSKEWMDILKYDVKYK